MKVLFLGDIMGRAGREAVEAALPGVRRRLALDFVVANGENAAHGFGLTPDLCVSLFAAGVDVLTSGNHIWDRNEILPALQAEPRLLRPGNYPANSVGRGSGDFETKSGLRVRVLNVIGQRFMEPADSPFAWLARQLPPGVPRRSGLDAVIIDFHGEASSEKQAAAAFCDGRATLLVGTHTHVPTADARSLPQGTAFQTDAGMCGCYDSIIGMETPAALARTLGGAPRPRLTPASGVATLCGVVVETDPDTGLARYVAPFRSGGALRAAWPG